MPRRRNALEMAENKTKAGKRRRALGRGIEALFPATPAKSAPAATKKTGPSKDERADVSSDGANAVYSCPIERIQPRADQPRKHFDAEALEELAQTIREHGVIQPIVVRRVGRDRFEIIAGERRWRAVQKAGLKEIPCVVKDVSPDTAFELALIENLQRQDLGALEIADAYERLLGEHGLTQQLIAERMGKSRVAIANTLRLLKLPMSIRTLIAEGRLSEGHGRALLGAPDERTMVAIAQKAALGRYAVRKVEQLVRASRKNPSGTTDSKSAANQKSAGVRDLELRLSRRIGARTIVQHKGKGGSLVVHYADLDDLDAIIERLGC